MKSITCIPPIVLGILNLILKMSLTNEQFSQLREYLDTILELYTEDEYEEFVEDIVINYCNTRFGIDEEESKKLFYEILNEKNG